MTPTRYLPLTQKKNWYTLIGVAIVIIATLTTGYLSEFDIVEALKAISGISNFIITDFLPPSVSATPDFASSLLDTISMPIVATSISAIFSLVLALLCAAPVTPHIGFKIAICGLASMLRNIPSLAWVIVQQLQEEKVYLLHL